MATRTVRSLIDQLGMSSRALAALGAAVEARLTGTPLSPAVQPHVDEVLRALDARQLVDSLDPAELRPILGAIRTELFLGAQLATGGSAASGWASDEPLMLQAAGDVSIGFPGVLKHRIAPELDGLPERLAAADAAFLDIGVGVAAMAIEMVRQWPALWVVGIDPLAAAITIGRDNVRQSGLAEQIELRVADARDLSDEGRFDLAWVPGAFISEEALVPILQRVRRALRPGGWALVALANPGPDPLRAALTRLRRAIWGGVQAAPAEMEELLARSGLQAVRTLPGPPDSVIAMVAGRSARASR